MPFALVAIRIEISSGATAPRPSLYVDGVFDVKATLNFSCVFHVGFRSRLYDCADNGILH